MALILRSTLTQSGSICLGPILSSSLWHATSTDFPHPLPPLVPIVHHSRQVSHAASCIGTELLSIGSSWLPYPYSSVWRGPHESIFLKEILLLGDKYIIRCKSFWKYKRHIKIESHDILNCNKNMLARKAMSRWNQNNVLKEKITWNSFQTLDFIFLKIKT